MSITDASEYGGAAAEAVRFSSALKKDVARATSDLTMNALESLEQLSMQARCSVCRGGEGEELLKCPLGCGSRCCSVRCYLNHRTACSHQVLDKSKVVISSPKDEGGLIREMVRNGISVAIETPGRKKFPETGLLVVFPHMPPKRLVLVRAARTAGLKQLDAVWHQMVEGRLVVALEKR